MLELICVAGLWACVFKLHQIEKKLDKELNEENQYILDFSQFISDEVEAKEEEENVVMPKNDNGINYQGFVDDILKRHDRL